MLKLTYNFIVDWKSNISGLNRYLNLYLEDSDQGQTAQSRKQKTELKKQLDQADDEIIGIVRKTKQDMDLKVGLV